MTDQMTEEKRTPPPPEAHRQSRQSLVLPILLPVGALAAIGLVLFGFSRVLLSLTGHAATAVALVVTVAIMAVATVVASRERLSNSTLFSMIGAVAGVAMLAGGIAILAIGNGEKSGGGAQTISIAAPKGAAATGFAPTTLSVEADKPIALTFDNQDPGVQHNVVIFSEDPAKNPNAVPVFDPKVFITGPTSFTYQVQALTAGTYFFHCAVHPTTMFGTIDVGAGGGGSTVTAKSLAFDTNEIDLPAGQATTLTFNNQDAGVPHNIAIYTDSSKSKALFQGEQFPGVASQPYDIPALDPGTYYFQCDVHNTMNGTVVVGAAPGAPASASSAPPSG
jgi:plastocyanin